MRLFISCGAPVEPHEAIPRSPKSTEFRYSRVPMSVSPVDGGLWKGGVWGELGRGRPA